jgi:hypothetical protein
VYPGIFFWVGVQQIKLRTEGRENGDLGAVAPYSGVPLDLQMSENCILIRLLRMYFPQNWEFVSAFQNFGILEGGSGWTPQNPPLVSHWYTTPSMKFLLPVKMPVIEYHLYMLEHQHWMVGWLCMINRGGWERMKLSVYYADLIHNLWNKFCVSFPYPRNCIIHK